MTRHMGWFSWAGIGVRPQRGAAASSWPASAPVAIDVHVSVDDITDPALTPSQRAILEFSPSWFNVPRETSRHIEGNPNYSRLHECATAAASADRREGWDGPRTVLQIEAAAKL